jgi:hypothetical protein
MLGIALAACLLAVLAQSVSGQAAAAASAGKASGAVVRCLTSDLLQLPLSNHYSGRRKSGHDEQDQRNTGHSQEAFIGTADACTHAALNTPA